MPDEKTAAAEKDFETLLKDLTQVVEKLERGSLSLDESIALYAKGTELLKSAQGVLDRAQARLDVLVATPDGPKEQPVDPNDLLG